MGLDMYFSKKTYVKNWDHNSPEETIELSVKRGGKIHPTINPKKVTYIQEEVGYWRKANHIHAWFVANVQDGVDECKEYYVNAEKMKELLKLCKEIKEKCQLVPGKVTNGYRFDEKGEKIYDYVDGKIMTNPKFAAERLPTQSGFFFGGTEYDEWYMKDIDNTIEILEAEMAINYDTVYEPEYYYRASW